MRLKQIIENPNTKPGKVFALAIQFLILVSVISFSIETLPSLTEKSRTILRWIEIVTVAIFSVEYLLRLFVADNKLRFVFSFYGLIDLLAVLPFYFRQAVDLRAIRIVRMLRLFRLLKFVRYGNALRRFRIAFRSIKSELVVFMTATAFLIYIASVGIYYFEREVQPEKFASVFHAMWWAIVTLSTVGYGDVYPVTIGGRIFTAVLLLIGLAVIAVPSGLLASALTATTVEEQY